MLPVFPRNVGSLEIQITQKNKNPNIWRKKKKKRKSQSRGQPNVCSISGSYLSKTAWTLGPEGIWGYIYMLEPSCIYCGVRLFFTVVKHCSIVGHVCVKGSEANGRREQAWFRHPSSRGLSPAMSNRHRCCCSYCCCCCCSCYYCILLLYCCCCCYLPLSFKK